MFKLLQTLGKHYFKHASICYSTFTNTARKLKSRSWKAEVASRKSEVPTSSAFVGKYYLKHASKCYSTLTNTVTPEMFNNKVAEGYQQNSSWQRQGGIQFVQSEVKPCPGEDILDLGCGTGELSAYLAELVGPNGRVLGVDPDKERLKVAQQSHKGIKNVSFVEGSTSNFPGLASETYDIIISNHVLHWVEDKEQAFKNMFNSLKPDGKIALQYSDRLPTVSERVFRELNPENADRLLNLFHLETRPVIEKRCVAAGFKILKSYDIKGYELEFQKGESLLSFYWASTNGAFDPHLVTEDMLASFFARYSSGEAGRIKLSFPENDFHSALIAVKPAKA